MVINFFGKIIPILLIISLTPTYSASALTGKIPTNPTLISALDGAIIEINKNGHSSSFHYDALGRIKVVSQRYQYIQSRSHFYSNITNLTSFERKYADSQGITNPRYYKWESIKDNEYILKETLNDIFKDFDLLLPVTHTKDRYNFEIKNKNNQVEIKTDTKQRIILLRKKHQLTWYEVKILYLPYQTIDFFPSEEIIDYNLLQKSPLYLEYEISSQLRAIAIEAFVAHRKSVLLNSGRNLQDILSELIDDFYPDITSFKVVDNQIKLTSQDPSDAIDMPVTLCILYESKSKLKYIEVPCLDQISE